MTLSEEITDYITRHRYRQINSALVWQDGQILAENYYNGFTQESRNVLCSVAKSILSLAAGIALDAGLLPGLDIPIANYLPQFLGGRDPMHPLITVRHLLTMTSGIYWNGGIHYHCPMMEQMRRSRNWLSHIADCTVTDIPGTRYNYKEFDVILLAAVLEAACGDLYDFIDRKLYAPLGIRSGRWYKSPCGVYYSVGDGEDASEEPSNLTAREMLAIGQLCLAGGSFGGQRIVSEAYLAEAVCRPVPAADSGGKAITAPVCEAAPTYGYLFWLGPDWYACRGYGGQRIHVFPDENKIVILQATPTDRGMAYDDLIWKIREL